MSITYSQAREHATQCGYTLALALGHVDAVPVQHIVSRSKSGRGAWLAIDVVNPETLETIYPAGYWLDDEDIPKLEALGVDYVILEN